MLIIAHRGASRYAPENTLASFEKALALGCDGIELDVHLTRDGRLVVLHDVTVDRTTGGHGPVAEMTWDQLRRLDAGSWFSDTFTGQRIPTLDDVLDILPDSMLLNVEIKGNPKGDRLETQLLKTLSEWRPDGPVIVSSFYHERLQRLRALDPDIRIGILGDRIPPDPMGYVARLGLNAYSLHLDHRVLDPNIVKMVKTAGYRLYAYTVNHVNRAKTLSEWGVDGLFTDVPDRFTPLR